MVSTAMHLNNKHFKKLMPVFLAIIPVVAMLLFDAHGAGAACDDPASQNVDWFNCRKRNLMINGSDLTGANLTRTDFASTDLSDTILSKAKLQKAVLVRTSLAGATAIEADFSKALGYRADFSGADLRGSNFSYAEILRTTFAGANLENTSFEKADLGRADFSGAHLTGSDFELANLARANMRGIEYKGNLDFGGAFLMQTHIEGLDLSRTTGLRQWQLEMACGDDKTVLPGDLVKPDSWPCKVDDDVN